MKYGKIGQNLENSVQGQSAVYSWAASHTDGTMLSSSRMAETVASVVSGMPAKIMADQPIMAANSETDQAPHWTSHAVDRPT